MKKINVIFNESNNYIITILRRRKINIININNNIFTLYKDDLEKIPKIYIKKIDYVGLDRLVEVFKDNKYFFVVGFLCFILMIISSRMIFKIEIMHDDKEIRNIIRESLRENNVHAFTFSKSYNELERIKKEIKKNYKDRIEWLDIVREGVVYKVKVEERVINKRKSTPKLCDIISMKDANIINYNVYRGEALKDLGDFVSKGETIISGTINFNENTVGYTCANGEIYGNTWYKISVNIPFAHYVKQPTKRKMINIGVQKGSKYKRLFNIHFKNYDISKKKIVSIGSVKIYFEIVKEYKISQKIYTKKEALDEASRKAYKSLKNRIGKRGDILSEKVLQSEDYNSIMMVEFFYSVSEPIGRQVAREIPQKGEKEDETTR